MELIRPGYTRVSEILSIFQAYSYVPREKLKKAQDIGTDVHDSIAMYLTGGWTPLDSKREGYFLSFLSWKEKNQIHNPIVEQRLYHGFYTITGKPDLVCELNGVPTIVDFKTGSLAHPKIWKLQATFYRSMLEVKPDKFLFVQLIKDGSNPILFPMDYDPEDWRVCDAAMTAYEYFCLTT